jgi:hypothetical protein
MLALWINQLDRKGNQKSASTKSIKPINSRTVMRLFKEWGWMPANPLALEDHFLEKAAHHKLAAFSDGEHTLPNLNKNHPKYGLLFAQDRRGKLFWSSIQHPITDSNYVDFCQKNINRKSKRICTTIAVCGLAIHSHSFCMVSKEYQNGIT